MVDEFTQTLVDGANINNRLRALDSGIEARAQVYEMSAAELRAAVLQATFSHMQQRLSSDAYSEWQDAPCLTPAEPGAF